MRGKKHSETLVTVTFRIKESTITSLRAMYPKVGYSEVLRRLAESHVAKKLSKEIADVSGDDTQGAVRETAE